MNFLSLPIDLLIPDIVATSRTNNSLVIQASPGSGKTTRIPPAILTSGVIGPDQKIYALVPRRLAAKFAAERVALEMGERPGETVGYQFRFERVIGQNTRLIFLTEGMLMRFLVSDPLLQEAGCIILDEFHERHLHTDVALAVLRRLQKTSRPDLKILVMSATLATGAIATFLGGAPVIEQKSPPHPLQIVYRAPVAKERLEDSVRDAVKTVLHDSAKARGHILVFLPGMAAIRRCEECLLAERLPNVDILPLHGDLPRQEQERIFAPTDHTKIILATNIAESSLTIDGVNVVIDSGLHRQARFSSWSGVPALVTCSTSRASAIQRAGRAARTGPGTCVRLYSEYDFSGRPEYDRPEIRRSELTQIILELLCAGIDKPQELEWLEAPEAGALQHAMDLLRDLGAVESENTEGLSAIGRRMAGLPLHPRLARLLIAAEENSSLGAAARLAARISEGELESLNALDDASGGRLPENVRRSESQILRFFEASAASKKSPPVPPISPVMDPGSGGFALAEALFHGLPDRVAKIRARQQNTQAGPVDELVFASGGSAIIASGTLPADTDYICVLDVRETQTQGGRASRVQVSSFVPILEDWLLAGSPRLLRDIDEISWDEVRQSVVAKTGLSYGAIIIESAAQPAPADARTAALMMRHALGLDTAKAATLSLTDIMHALSHFQDAEVFAAAWARTSLLRQHRSDADWSGFATTPGEALMSVLTSVTKAASLRAINLAAHLIDTLPPDLRHLIDSLLPTSIALPSGRRAKIHYDTGKSPWVESRLQDFFGLKETPKLCGGRVPLTLHLLAPNGRAVQVTTDLMGFWNKTYPELRTQLMRRYPRQKWPEKP